MEKFTKEELRQQNKQELTLDDIKDTTKPHFTKNGNIKLGEGMWVWSTMYGNHYIIVKDYGKACSGTCDKHCEGCEEDCYVKVSYRYGSVIKGHAINTTWLKEDPDATFEALDKQLKRARKKPQTVRWNQSGELLDGNLEKLVKLAKDNPNVTFYVYTKNYAEVKKANQHEIPKNLYILISVWHEYGVDEYNEAINGANSSQIKAFIYADDENKLRLKPQVYCPAYKKDPKTGKTLPMDHSVTCGTCRLCFNSKAPKLIGCLPH